MDRVVILALDDLRHITMSKIYTDFFDEKGIKYDIICMDRYNHSSISNLSDNIYCYKGTSVSDSKFRKLFNYIQYRNYAISIINKNKYKYIIVWGERTTAVFSDFLVSHRPYCINIRDLWFPKFTPILKRLRKAVDNSDFSTWCAPRGQEYLPKHDYVLVYNQNKSLVCDVPPAKCLVKKGEPIHIGAIGYIRHLEPAKQIMKAFCNDDRFVVQFFGTGSEQLKKYANELNMNNIEIIGSFRPEETAELVQRIDIVNCYCGDGSQDKTIAIGTPIRYGYSTMLYKPAIVSPNTYISEKTNSMDIALTFDERSDFSNILYEWYHGLDFATFVNRCNEFNNEISDTIDNFHRVCEEKITPLFRE